MQGKALQQPRLFPFTRASRLSDSLPTLIRFPVPPTVAGSPRQRRLDRSLLAPEQASIVAVALLGIRERAVRSMDLHELARRGFLSLHRRHVRVAHPRQPPVRRPDFLAGRRGADPQNVVQRRARSHPVMRSQIRSCLMLLLLRESGGGERYY